MDEVTPKLGIAETKEALHGILVVGALLAKQAKDGLKLDDAAALVDKFVNDEAFKLAVTNAVNGIEKVPAEVKDLDVMEAVELVTACAPDILKIIGELKA